MLFFILTTGKFKTFYLSKTANRTEAKTAKAEAFGGNSISGMHCMSFSNSNSIFFCLRRDLPHFFFSFFQSIFFLLIKKYELFSNRIYSNTLFIIQTRFERKFTVIVLDLLYGFCDTKLRNYQLLATYHGKKSLAQYFVYTPYSYRG